MIDAIAVSVLRQLASPIESSASRRRSSVEDTLPSRNRASVRIVGDNGCAEDDAMAGACQLMAGTGTRREPLTWSLRRHLRPISLLVDRKAREFYRDSRRVAKEALRRVWPTARCSPIAVTAPTGPIRGSRDSDSNSLIVAGARVRVKALHEIRSTLDGSDRLRGCAFLAPMAQYCGREYRVIREVERFFDERSWRLLKCLNVVLFEGVFCDGSGHPATQGCDRMCFFFWRKEWLTPCDAPAPKGSVARPSWPG